MMRARLLLIAGIAASVATACATGGTGPSGAARGASEWFAGADVSALTRIEQAGGVFRDSGRVTDALAALRARGSNTFRLRLFLAPNNTEVQVNDLPYTIALAQRAKATGATLLLDFHYSDTWADPGHQITPAAWAALDIDSLEQRVEDYTASVLAQFKSAGVLPALVQVGNEIDGGLLWPLGQIGMGGAGEAAAEVRFGRLLRAGVRGVRRATGPSDSVRIVLQYSQGANTEKTQWFFDIVAAQGVAYDIIGFSYYPWWHGPLSELQRSLTATALRYDKDIIVVETSYPWRAGFAPGGTFASAMTWPVSVAGQLQFTRDVAAAVAATPNGHGKGVIWWYAEAIRVPQPLFIYGDGALALFSDSGTVLPAAAAMQKP